MDIVVVIIISPAVGGGGVLTKIYYGDGSAPRFNPLPVIYQLGIKGTPFMDTFYLEWVTLSHI